MNQQTTQGVSLITITTQGADTLKVKLSLDTEDFEAIFQDLDYLKSIKIKTLQPRTMAVLQLIISECVRKSYKAQYKANFLEDVDYDVLINCLYKD